MLCHPLFVKWLRKEGTNVRFYRISTIYVSNFSSLYGSSLSAGREGVICLVGSGCGGVAPRWGGGGAPAGAGAGAGHQRGRGTAGVGAGLQLGRGRGSSSPGKYRNFELHHAAGGGLGAGAVLGCMLILPALGEDISHHRGDDQCHGVSTSPRHNQLRVATICVTRPRDAA